MVIHKVNPATTHFLNVDPDVYSEADLQPLVAALGNKVMVLYVGRIRQTHCEIRVLGQFGVLGRAILPAAGFQPALAD
jgi:hypothetical protein